MIISKLIIGGVVAAAVLIGGFVGLPQTPTPEAPMTTPLFGATDFKFAQLKPYYLSGAGAVAGATTVILRSMEDVDGNTLTMSAAFGVKGFGTIEPGNGSQQEQISFTGLTNNSNGTVTLTGVKSVTFLYPYTETSGLLKSHPGSATFVISNTSGFYNQLMSPMNNATITALYIFSSTTPPRYDNVGAQSTGTFIATTSEFASISYVNAVSFSGTTNASEGVKGISQFATQAQMAASTNLGSSAAGLVLQSQYATSSPGSAGFWAVITRSTAKIAQAFLDLTEAFTFSGGLTSSATTTIAASNASTTALVLNGLPYEISTTRGASSTVLAENGYGHLSWFRPDFALIAATTTSAVTATTTLTGIPSSQDLKVVVDVPSVSGSVHLQFNGDTTATYTWYAADMNGAAIGAAEAVSAFRLVKVTSAGASVSQLEIRNISSRRKTVSGQTTMDAAGADQNWINQGFWANTSAQISSISIGCFPSTCPSGTVIRVYGSNQ